MIAPQDEPSFRTLSRKSAHFFAAFASGQKNGLRSTSDQSQVRRSMACGHARHYFSRDGAGGNAARRLARTRAPRAAPVAQAVFGEIGVVGVARAELVLDVAVVLGPGIDVVDFQRDGRAGGHLLAACLIDKYAGEDAHLVRLLTLRRVARLAGLALVEIGLDVGNLDLNTRRAAIDHAANCRPVAFAPGGDAEQMAETVVRHGFLLSARPGCVQGAGP
jgi:hypothetical protein